MPLCFDGDPLHRSTVDPDNLSEILLDFDKPIEEGGGKIRIKYKSQHVDDSAIKEGSFSDGVSLLDSDEDGFKDTIKFDISDVQPLEGGKEFFVTADEGFVTHNGDNWKGISNYYTYWFETTPKTVLFAIDKSTSMKWTANGEKKITSAKANVKQQIDMLPDDIRAAVMAFAKDRNTVVSRQKVGGNRSSMKSAIDNISAGGGTDLIEPLREAKDMLTADEEVKIYSDGQPNNDPSDPNDGGTQADWDHFESNYCSNHQNHEYTIKYNPIGEDPVSNVYDVNCSS